MIQRKPQQPALSSKDVFPTPMLLNWTDEKLAALDQDQLLNLLGNLDHQRQIGRLGGDTADALEARITALLSGRHLTKRRKALAERAADDAAQA